MRKERSVGGQKENEAKLRSETRRRRVGVR